MKALHLKLHEKIGANIDVVSIDINWKALNPDAKEPTNSEDDIGWDFYSVEDRIIPPLVRAKIKTGIAIQPPKGYHILLWDRSGMSANRGLHRLAGVIDQSYTGELEVCLINLSEVEQIIKKGDKIVQGIIQQKIPAKMIKTDVLEKTSRGDKGFGSSG